MRRVITNGEARFVRAEGWIFVRSLTEKLNFPISFETRRRVVGAATIQGILKGYLQRATVSPFLRIVEIAPRTESVTFARETLARKQPPNSENQSIRKTISRVHRLNINEGREGGGNQWMLPLSADTLASLSLCLSCFPPSKTGR